MSNSRAFAYEIERTLYESSAAWEGFDEQEIPLDVGEVVLRKQPGFAIAMPLHFQSATLDVDLDRAIEQVEKIVPECLWIIGPGSQPPDLQQHLQARGFVPHWEWTGLALDDLSLVLLPTPGLTIEPLSRRNIEEYACAFAEDGGPSQYEKYLKQAQRYLQHSPQEVQIDIARLDGVICACSVLRIEPNGVAYLRNAKTLPAFRNRGIYRSLVAHRLAIARGAACSTAIVQALSHTSAPILIGLGFKPVCRITALTRR
jgi:hypothetical protein